MKKIISLFLVLGLFPLAQTVQAGANLGQLTISKTVRNISRGESFQNSTTASTGEQLEFQIEVSSANQYPVANAVVTDTFPTNLLTYTQGSLTVNGQNHATGLTNGGLRFSSVDQSPIIILYQATASRTGSSNDTARARGQSGTAVNSSTSIVVEAGTNGNNDNGGNDNNSGNTDGTMVNSAYLSDLDEHACLHMENGPDRNVTASSNPVGAPEVSRAHTRFIISVPGNNGYVSYRPSSSGDYVIYSNNNTPIAILNSAGGEVSSISGSPSNCSSASQRVLTQLSGGTYNIRLGPGAPSSVNLVVEKAEQNVFNPGTVAGDNTFIAPETGASKTSEALAFGLAASLLAATVRNRKKISKLITA